MKNIWKYVFTGYNDNAGGFNRQQIMNLGKFVLSLCDFLFTKYRLILYEYSNVEGFDLIDLERIFNHKYFDLSEICLKVYFT